MQCPQCRQPNDHNARFCVQCGARVRASACPACGGSLPAPARFCPTCGTAVADVTPAAVADVKTAAVAPPAQDARDPAEALLTARTVDGIEEEPPTPAEEALFHRVRTDRAHARTVRRRVALVAVGAIVLIAALVWSQRSGRAPMTASVPPPATPEPPEKTAMPEPAGSPPVTPPATEQRAEPNPAPRASIDLPTRTPRQSPGEVARRDTVSRAEPPSRAEQLAHTESWRGEPAAMPRPETRRPSDVRVQVAHVPNGSGTVDYTVRVSRPDGAPVHDADVRVRGIMSDGGLVEARLDPGEPGVYRGLLTFSSRGPRGLTVRVTRNGDLVEVPVADSPAPGAPRP